MSGEKSCWTIFRSMKTGLYLVMAIIIASIAGTVVPQQQAGGQRGGLEFFLQLNDLYHSWWYITLLSLLTFNLVACSFYRLKIIRLKSGRSRKLLESGQLAKLRTHTSFTLNGDADEVSNKILGILDQRGYEVWLDYVEGRCRIGAQQGRFSAWGSFITHFSFVVIVIGVLYGAVFGYQGSINAPVNTTFSLSEVPGINSRDVKNDFQVRVEKFWIERYSNGAPSGYYSRLSILENDTLVKTATLGVNSPLSYEGIKFYQSCYGNAIQVQVNGPDNTTIQQELVIEGESMKIPGSNLSMVTYLDRSDNEAASGTASDSDNLRVIYILFEGDQQVGMGAGEFGSAINLDHNGNTFKFVGAIPFTGLQVKKDPGIPLIWLGSLFMLLGMGFSFFLQPRSLWMVIEPENKLARVSIGGKTSKNQLALTDYINNMAKEIQTGQPRLFQVSITNPRRGHENGYL